MQRRPHLRTGLRLRDDFRGVPHTYGGILGYAPRHHAAVAAHQRGQPLLGTVAGSCGSATEALCVSPGLEANRKLDRNPQYAELVRQLTAAKLNLVATATNGGSCGSAITARIAACEALCGASKGRIIESGCIADLDAFNNSLDTFAVTPSPFESPGAADPASCQAAHGNGIVIGKSCD